MVSLLNRNKIRWACRNRKSLTFMSHKLSASEELSMEAILAVFLEEINLLQVRDQLSYCLRELAINAKKANTKRIFFNEEGLDICNPDDYIQGMQCFKDDTLSDIQHYLKLQEEAGLYIKITFSVSRQYFTLTVENNVELVPQENERIKEKLTKAKQYQSLQEAFVEIFDQTEGAGLGLVIMVLMLNNLGMDQSVFSFNSSDGKTFVKIKLPLENQAYDFYSLISEALLNEVDHLPPFPKDTQKILNMINSDTSLNELIFHVMKDPALAVNILKIVNSETFGLKKAVANVSEAIQLIGKKGLRDILLTFQSKAILNDYSQDEDLWKHSQRTAFYAWKLLESGSENINQYDVHTAALLHDVGKILFNFVYPQAMHKIQIFCNTRGIPISVLEELSEGTNHGVIGSLMLKKWKFPDSLVSAIAYHHHPEAAPKEFYKLTSLVYLANCLANHEEEILDYGLMEPQILELYGINSEEEFTAMHIALEKAFKNEQMIKFEQTLDVH